MGKVTGFLDYAREDNKDVPVEERIKNFKEFHIPLTEEERRKQGARCMNCGVPFCQSGMKLAGMFTGCPLHNLCPEWNDEVYNGHVAHALSRLLKTNNFPEFTGRVCPALCEKACVEGLDDAPVTTHDNELYIIEKAFQEGYMQPRIPEVRSGKRVAVIGGGDTGNDCCGTAIRQGAKSVTQIEMMPEPPVERAASNPWPEWPKVLKVDYGQQEAIRVFGHDPRVYETTVKAIETKKDGSIKDVITSKVKFENRQMVLVEGTEQKLPCDLLIIAAGFTGCESYVADAFGVALTERHVVKTEAEHYHTESAVKPTAAEQTAAAAATGSKVGEKSGAASATAARTTASAGSAAKADASPKTAANAAKIFTAGDMHRGQSLVVWAIAEGRTCASEVDAYLMGYSCLA